MKKNYSHIAVVIDESGSMESMRNEVIEGFNKLLSDQNKVKGEATITIVHFDDEYKKLVDFSPIKSATKLSRENYQPDASTALLDAMGKTMNDVRSHIKEMKEDDKPSKVIFVFITDGHENASREYSRDIVFEMITDLKDSDNTIKHEFVFIGANQDAIMAGSSLGIRKDASLTWDASGAGAKAAFSALSRGMTDYRTVSDSYSFTDEERKEQDDLMKK